MCRLFLIRHAWHDAIGKYLSGAAPGLHLNDVGRRQLPILVAALHAVPFDAVVSSPLERTRETAEPIARDHDLDVVFDDRFIEYGVGEWSGRTFASLNPTPDWRRFNDLRSVSRAPGGELMLDVQQRAVGAMLDWRDAHPSGNVAIVSHGDVIRAMLLYVLGMAVDMLHRIEVSPALISVVELDADSMRVVQMNAAGVPPSSS
jgi:probable phosphoglycerate mutase